jgi:exportin-5
LYLEEIKADDEAPYHGFTLACDRNQEPVIRHYALSLLEHAIKHRWTEFSEAQAYTLRSWILQLAENIDRGDPLYLRNKTAQLWVEVAKRTWGGDWLDMDELLVRLWETTSSMVHKEFVLFVLETLSEEVFNGDDATAAMREGVLSKACVEIFTPAEVLSKSFPDRHVGAGVRYREDGWLVRLGLQLEICLDGGVDSNEEYRTCAVKILSVFRSTMPWAIPNAIAGASCVMHMSTSLAAPSIPVQMV